MLPADAQVDQSSDESELFEGRIVARIESRTAEDGGDDYAIEFGFLPSWALDDKEPWTEAMRTYAHLLPTGRYLAKSVLARREEDDNRRWLRSTLISLPINPPAKDAAASDADFATEEESGSDDLTGRVIVRYSPDSAGRLRVEFGFLPSWAFSDGANTQQAAERWGGLLFTRARYISAQMLVNLRDVWLRSSVVTVPLEAPLSETTEIDITAPNLEYDQIESVEAARIGTVRGPLTDQLEPITVTGAPRGLTVLATDAGESLKRLVLSGTVAADAPARSYTVRIIARPPDGDPVSASLTIRIRPGDREQELSWAGYSPNTERIGGRVTLRPPRVVEGPQAPRWTYVSDTARICTVDESTGALTLLERGQCQITATSAAADGYRESAVRAEVTVTDSLIPVISWDGYEPARATVGETPPRLLRPSATVDGRAVLVDYTFQVGEDSERDGICDVNMRSGALEALAAGTCFVIAKSTKTDDYAAGESRPVRVTIIKDAQDSDLRWDGYDAENFGVGSNPLRPLAPQPLLREARGNLTFTYDATPRSVCSVDPSTGELMPHRGGICDVTLRSAETDEFLAGEVTVSVRVGQGPQEPDLFWFDYPSGSAVAGGNSIMPSRPGSRDRVGPLTYRSETPGICSIDSRTGRLTGRQNGTCRATVISARTSELLEDSETISVPISDQEPPNPCTLSYSSDVNVGEQVAPRIDCGDGDGRARYETETPRICDVNRNSGDVTGLARGQCRITATVPETSRYSGATARATLSVAEDGPPECDAIGDIGPLDSGQSARSIRLGNYCRDPENERLSYTATSSNSDTATVRLSGDSLTVMAARDGDGTATITVTATDPAGQRGQTSFRVTVEGNRSPAASSIPSETLNEGETTTVNLWSYFSDPDNDRLTYDVRSSNASVATASESSEVLTITARSTGAATITITANDGNGGSVPGTIAVTVRGVEAPVINSISCSPSSPQVDESVACSASLSGGTPDTYSWSGGASSGSGSRYTTRFSTSGDKTISLTVSNRGGSDSASTSVTVPPGMASCGIIRDILTTTGAPSQMIDLNSYCTHPGGGRLTYSNASSDNTSVAGVDLSGSTITVSPGSTAGVANISVRVGGSGLDDRTVNNWFEVIVNAPRITAPQINSITCTPPSPTANQSVTCTASMSGGTPTSWSWSGGSSTGSDQDYRVRFGHPGTYTISLTVSNAGGSDSDTDTIRVMQVLPDPPQIRSINCTPKVEASSTISCTARTRGGGPTSWSWSATGGGRSSSSSSYSTSISSFGRHRISLTVSNDGGSDSDSVNVQVVATPPSSTYGRCGSDAIRVYWFDRTNLNKHHVNLTGEEATRILGASWWSTIGSLSQSACDSWPTGAALTAANYR